MINGDVMHTIEYAYELADQYTAKTSGYTVIEIFRWNHGHEDSTYIEYCLSAQALQSNDNFTSIDALVERLKELLA
jgi:hypothetical protein